MKNDFDLVNEWAIDTLITDFGKGDSNPFAENSGYSKELIHVTVMIRQAQEVLTKGILDHRLDSDEELFQYVQLLAANREAAREDITLEAYCAANGLSRLPVPEKKEDLNRPLLPIGMYFFNECDYAHPLCNPLQTNIGCV